MGTKLFNSLPENLFLQNNPSKINLNSINKFKYIFIKKLKQYLKNTPHIMYNINKLMYLFIG